MRQQSNGKSHDVGMWPSGLRIDQKLARIDERKLCGRGPGVSQWRPKRAPGDGSDDGLDEWEESSYDQVKTRTPRFGNDQRRDLCRDTRPSKAGKSRFGSVKFELLMAVGLCAQ